MIHGIYFLHSSNDEPDQLDGAHGSTPGQLAPARYMAILFLLKYPIHDNIYEFVENKSWWPPTSIKI